MNGHAVLWLLGAMYLPYGLLIWIGQSVLLRYERIETDAGRVWATLAEKSLMGFFFLWSWNLWRLSPTKD